MTDHLGQDNYREVAQEAIKHYRNKRMVVDAMLWEKIVMFYEEELQEAKDTLASLNEDRGPHPNW